MYDVATRASCADPLQPLVGGLEPPAHGSLIVQVRRTEFPFKVLLFSRYDDTVDVCHRPDERGQQPHAVASRLFCCNIVRLLDTLRRTNEINRFAAFNCSMLRDRASSEAGSYRHRHRRKS